MRFRPQYQQMIADRGRAVEQNGKLRQLLLQQLRCARQVRLVVQRLETSTAGG